MLRRRQQQRRDLHTLGRGPDAVMGKALNALCLCVGGDFAAEHRAIIAMQLRDTPNLGDRTRFIARLIALREFKLSRT
jgi:hypothetical protein